ncbi:LOW QUALITY PROTEIN: heat stress transcription factor A-1-like [Asparagus officinalis]|uniref:LOW QUALITY PROTEIN: heat stress transcription factor A-1-like n=1 Tax=Asparagus officinalis TaxID=4686 RepID=UPI00098E7E7E|nr:LOW QUALITY PROTEIN: heat stress transcription factor A-1-like [Asparagus officinalis]
MESSVTSGSPAAAAAGTLTASAAVPPPPFLSKTYDMVDDPSRDAIVSWGPNNNSFVVWNTPEFARDLLPKHFKHNNFSSFVRQLNTYGFRKVDPDRWEFANEGFLRGQKHLLKTITRRKPSHVQSQPHPPQPQNSAVAACVEVGKFGLEEEIEQLKRDKNVLMQELVRLRQQQQTTDHQLQTLGDRLHGMEQRQQQMMAFLAKAMQSPGFLAQLVQQNDSNRRITAGNKKRRFPKQRSELNVESSSPDGQIIKYQPLINEAAKAMLMQILKLDSSPRLDPLNNSDGFLIDNFPSQLNSVENISSTTRTSRVTLKEVPTTSGIPYLPSNSGVSSSASTPSTSTSIVDMVKEPIAPVLSPMQGVVTNGDSVNIVPENYSPLESDNGYVPNIPPSVDEHVPLDLDSLTDDIGFLNDVENDMGTLPGIEDPFWEQFLDCPVPGNDDSDMQENGEVVIEEQNGWSNAQNMDNLTEQMGHLTSENKK